MKYSQQDIIPVRAKLRFSTLIVLPQNEEILDYATGDKEFWIINGAHNLCYVHPAQAGIRSDLHLITSTGRVYSFLLTEISNESSAEPDLKLFVEPKDESSIGGTTALQGYVRASEAEAYKKELEALHAQTDGQIHAAEARAAEQVNKYKADYQKKLQFDYELDKKARSRAVPCLDDLSRRGVYLHQVYRPREASSLRNQRRKAEPHQLPG